MRERFALTFRHISSRLLTGSSGAEIDVLARANKVLSPEKILGERSYLDRMKIERSERISRRARLERENPEKSFDLRQAGGAGEGAYFCSYTYIFFVFLTRVRANNKVDG